MIGLLQTIVDLCAHVDSKLADREYLKKGREQAPNPLGLAGITDRSQVEPTNYPFSISQRRLFLASWPYALFFEFVISVVRRDL